MTIFSITLLFIAEIALFYALFVSVGILRRIK